MLLTPAFSTMAVQEAASRRRSDIAPDKTVSTDIGSHCSVLIGCHSYHLACQVDHLWGANLLLLVLLTGRMYAIQLDSPPLLAYYQVEYARLIPMLCFDHTKMMMPAS